MLAEALALEELGSAAPAPLAEFEREVEVEVEAEGVWGRVRAPRLPIGGLALRVRPADHGSATSPRIRSSQADLSAGSIRARHTFSAGAPTVADSATVINEQFAPRTETCGFAGVDASFGLCVYGDLVAIS